MFQQIIIMQFELIHEEQITAETLSRYPLWAQYHVPDDIEIIVDWGVPREVVELAFKEAGWSDSYFFPVLNPKDVGRFYFYYAAASFMKPQGAEIHGAVSDHTPTSVWIFRGSNKLLLSQDDPELTKTEELELISLGEGTPLYPLNITFCALTLQKYTLDPYSN